MNNLLVSGRISQLTLLLLFSGYAYYYTTYKFKEFKETEIRPLAAVNALKEAVGRATELGRPVHFTFGSGGLEAQAFAGFAILGELAKVCAEYDCKILVSNVLPEVQPMTEEIVRQSFMSAGKVENYRSDDIRYFGSGSYNAAVLGTIEREKVAANVLVGNLFYEAVLFVEAGARNGAIQIGGTMNTHQLPFLAAGCDHLLIGAEMFAASAYLTRDSVRTGWLMGEEMCKLIGLALIIVGTVFSSLGSNFVAVLLGR